MEDDRERDGWKMKMNLKCEVFVEVVEAPYVVLTKTVSMKKYDWDDSSVRTNDSYATMCSGLTDGRQKEMKNMSERERERERKKERK